MGLLHRFQTTLTAAGRRASSTFSFEGIRLVERALRAGVALEGVLLSPGFDDRNERSQTLAKELAAANIPRETTDLRDLVGDRDLGGIIGLASIPAPVPPADWDRRLLLVAVDVFDAGNTGALVRTALASGASGFVAVGETDPYAPRAVRTSMGSLFKLPVHRVPDLESAGTGVTNGLDAATPAQWIGLTGAGSSITDVTFADHVALCVGSEAHGLSESDLTCLTPVRLPMRGGVDSFSVNAAAAIGLYEVQRQRKNN